MSQDPNSSNDPNPENPYGTPPPPNPYEVPSQPPYGAPPPQNPYPVPPPTGYGPPPYGMPPQGAYSAPGYNPGQTDYGYEASTPLPLGEAISQLPNQYI